MSIDQLTQVNEQLGLAVRDLMETWNMLEGATVETCMAIGEATGKLHTARLLLERDLHRLKGGKWQ